MCLNVAKGEVELSVLGIKGPYGFHRLKQVHLNDVTQEASLTKTGNDFEIRFALPLKMSQGDTLSLSFQ